MSEETKNMQLQIHLAEYSALRDEVLALIKWRDSLVFISLSISGTIYSFVFSQSNSNITNSQTHWTGLYLVAPLSTLVGGLWMVNSWRISRIGNYLKDVTAKKINLILNYAETEKRFSTEINVLEWESSSQRLKYKWERRTIEWFIYLMTFVVSGILSQILLLKDRYGSLWNRVASLEFPIVYLVNSLMVLIAFLGFIDYLLKGFLNIDKAIYSSVRLRRTCPLS